MKMRDYFLSQKCNFQNKLMYAMLTNPDAYNSDQKYGYIDGADYVLNSYKPVEELEAYISEYEVKNNPLDSYDKSYLSAIKDYIKQEEGVVTNE